MASAVRSKISSELEKKDVQAAGKEDNNPEELMDEEDDNEDGDVEEDVAVKIGATYSCKRQVGSYHDAEIVKTRMNKQAGREEFFVHFVGLNRRQNEWVDKTRLVIPRPVKEGQAAENTNLEATEEGKTPLKRESDADASDVKRVKVDVDTTPSTYSTMASGDFAEELTCLLCSEVFKDPVMVECGHNFCHNCIDKAWNGQKSFTCPDCKEVLTEKRYTTNRALANLVKKTVGTAAVPTQARPAERPKITENCPEHDERLKLYCKDDGTLSCVICRDSLKHASHNFLPILDAVAVYKTELSAIVTPLEEALKVTEQLSSQQGEKVEQHKSNVSESRQHIVSEFEKLRTFVKEHEEKLLEQLQEQGENLLKEMEANMVKLQENQDDIKETITMANERVNDTDSISFLTGIKSFIEKCQEQQKDEMVAGNTLLSEDLCQGSFKGPIQYSIWKQMKSFIVPCQRSLRDCSHRRVRSSSRSRSRSPAGAGSSRPEAGSVVGSSPAAPADVCAPSRPVAEPALHGAGPWSVFIVGHSYVCRAALQVSDGPMGPNLGLPNATVRWRGIGGLSWDGIRSLALEELKDFSEPGVLVVHAGGNDLGTLPTAVLLLLIKQDLTWLSENFPHLVLVWSDIVWRKVWHGARSWEGVDKARKSINIRIGRFMHHLGGVVVRHRLLEAGNPAYLAKDGVHLSFPGMEVFLLDLQEGVTSALKLLEGRLASR